MASKTGIHFRSLPKKEGGRERRSPVLDRPGGYTEGSLIECLAGGRVGGPTLSVCPSIRGKMRKLLIPCFAFFLVLGVLTVPALAESDDVGLRELFAKYIHGLNLLKEGFYVLVDPQDYCREDSLGAEVWRLPEVPSNVEGFRSYEDKESHVAPPLAMCSYTLMVTSIMEYITIYVAIPGFVLIVMWYVVRFGKQVYQGANKPLSYWGRHVFVLWLTATLLFPVQAVFGVEDHRPTALWLTFHSAKAGMELAGIVAGEVLDETKDLLLYRVEDEESPEVTIIEHLEDLLWNTEDDVEVFLGLPAMIMAYTVDTQEKIKQMDRELHEFIKNNPDLENSLHHVQKRKRSILKRIVMAVVGALIGIGGAFFGNVLMMVTGGVLFGSAADPELISKLTNYLVNMIKLAVADKVFAVALGASFYAGVLFAIMRMLIYGVIGPLKAFLMPLGDWGFQKVIPFFSNLLAFLLTFPLFVVFWFVGLIIRAFYLSVVHRIVFMFIEYVTWGASLQLVISIIAAIVLPMIFITPLAYLYLRTPVILNQFIGQVFQAGVSQVMQMRTLAPFAK